MEENEAPRDWDEILKDLSPEKRKAAEEKILEMRHDIMAGAASRIMARNFSHNAGKHILGHKPGCF
jgi:hypothetical protein